VKDSLFIGIEVRRYGECYVCDGEERIEINVALQTKKIGSEKCKKEKEKEMQRNEKGE
jgi:hypothetical protein